LHGERFPNIAAELKDYTSRAMVSLVDYYQKTNRRFTALEEKGVRFYRDAAESPDVCSLLKEFPEIAAHTAIQPRTLIQQGVVILNMTQMSVRKVELIDLKTLTGYINEMLEVLNNSSLTERRAFIRSFIQEIKVTGNDVLMTYSPPIPPDTLALKGDLVPRIAKYGGQ